MTPVAPLEFRAERTLVLLTAVIRAIDSADNLLAGDCDVQAVSDLLVLAQTTAEAAKVQLAGPAQ